MKSDRSAYIWLNAEIRSGEEEVTVRITRLKDGSHVNLDGCTTQWRMLDGWDLRLPERYGAEFSKLFQSIKD